MAFPCGSAGKESACNEGDLGSIPGLGSSPGERKGYPFQYYGLENCGVGEDSWESLWTARRYNQSILKEISLKYLLEGLMLKLKLQYSGHLM